MATVTGNIIDITTLPVVCPIKIASGGAPVLDGSSLVLKSEKIIPTDEFGNFSIVLAMGNYTVTATDPRTSQTTAVGIDVPDDTATYDFSSLITSTTIYDPAAPPGSGNPNATTIGFGIVKIDVAMVNPVVVTTTTWNAYGKGYFVVATLTALKALSSASTNKLAFVKGGAAAYDGDGGDYFWESAATTADDGITYIRPNDYSSAGIWRKR